MANSTQQFPINAIDASTLALPGDQNRRYMMLRNYSDSVQIIWVAFGMDATAGTNGEVEILPGFTYEFGTTRLISPDGLIANNETYKQPNCPIEFVSVICGPRGAPAGTAVGMIMVVTP